MYKRRHFLAVVAGAAATIAAWPSRAFAYTTRGITGLIAGFRPGWRMELQTQAGATVVQFLASASTFNRDGPASLSQFSVRDEVVVEIQAGTAANIGRRMELLYRVTYGTVTQVTDTHVITSGGRTRWTSSTVIHDADDYYRQHGIDPLVLRHSYWEIVAPWRTIPVLLFR